MRILSLTAGAAGMYCGSCLRDNALAAELIARGHDVTLMPLYTPTTTDEKNLSRHEVLFGGISVYLQQHVPILRKTPRALDRVWDSPRVIQAFAGRSVSNDPRLLGELTVSMLEAEGGVLRKEFDKMLEWLETEPKPDVVSLPNSLLIGLAKPLRNALNRPVCCTLQGEDLFIDGLVEPYRARVLALMRERTRDVDRFIAVSDFYAPVMSRLLNIPASRMTVVPLGINLAGYQRHDERGDSAFRVGYFARIAPEKGLHLLADAYIQFRQHTRESKARLDAAGYLPPVQTSYLDEVKHSLEKAGLAGEFTYHGALDRDGKLAFLRTLDVFSMPATYDEPKGVSVLEAMASEVPVVEPRRGAFTEIVEKTRGGLLVRPDDPAALAAGLFQLFENRAMARLLGTRGSAGVREHYDIARSADRLMEVYEEIIDEHRRVRPSAKLGAT